MSPWLRWLPSLHKVNVPSCRTNLAQSVWTAAHSEIPRLEKAPLAVCHLLRLTLAGLDARFMGGILEARGSAITNSSAAKETPTALEEIRTEGGVGGAASPESDEAFAAPRQGDAKVSPRREKKGGKKMRWAHGRSCSTSCRGMSRRPPENQEQSAKPHPPDPVENE